MWQVHRELREALEAGYCLHGSRLRLDVIEPRPARCETGRREGNLTAVYADTTSPAVPCLMALFAEKVPGKGYYSSYSNANDTLVVIGEGLTFRPGFIHVLPRDTFQWYGHEFVAFEQVPVLQQIRVTPAILWSLLAEGNLDLRVSIPPPW